MHDVFGTFVKPVVVRRFWLISAAISLSIISTSAATADGADPSAADIGSGIKMISSGKYDEAVRYFDHIISVSADPLTTLYAYTNRGEAYFKLRNYPKAQADLDTAIGLAPTEESAYMQRGRLFADQKLNDRAIADYSKALLLLESKGAQYAPGALRAGILKDRAKAYQAMGNNELAKRDEDSAASLKNDFRR